MKLLDARHSHTSMGRQMPATDVTMADAFVRQLATLVYIYPILWTVGLGATFFLITAAFSLLYLARVRICTESWLVLGIGASIVVSIPVGLTSFGFDFWRAVSAFGNVAAWITLAAGISAGKLVGVRPRLSYALITVGAIQGAATLVAVAVYPRQLPLPLLANQASFMPTGFRQFAARSLAYDGWLDGFAIRSSGIMAQPTWAGAFAALAAILALAEIARRRHQALLVGSLLLCGVSIYFSLSRTTYFVTILALAVAGLFVLRRRDRREFATAVAITLPIITFFVVSNWSQITELLSRVNGARKGSFIARFDIYAQTWRYLTDLGVPLVGFGIKPQEAGFWASIASHSTYLGLAFRGGIIALVFLIAFLVCLVRKVFADHNALGAAILVIITIWMIIGDLDVGHMLPLFLIFCVATPSRQYEVSDREETGS